MAETTREKLRREIDSQIALGTPDTVAMAWAKATKNLLDALETTESKLDAADQHETLLHLEIQGLREKHGNALIRIDDLQSRLDEEHKDAMKWSGIAGAYTNKATRLEERVRELESRLDRVRQFADGNCHLWSAKAASELAEILSGVVERHGLKERIEQAAKDREDRPEWLKPPVRE